MTKHFWCRWFTMVVAVGFVVLNSGGARAANAIWGEEMTALPDANRWGAWDDADGLLAGLIQQTSDPDDPANTGVWRVPTGSNTTGMAVINGPGNVDPPTAGLAQFTFEARYRIVGDNPFPTGLSGNFEAYPFAVNVGSQNSPAIDFADGYRSLSGVTNGDGYSYYQMKSTEGLNGFVHPAPGAVPASTRDAWHTLRITQDSVTSLKQSVYLDGTLVGEFDISGALGGTGGFTRSLWFRQDGQNTTTSMWRKEVLVDYFRVANGILDLNEPLNAVPEPTVAGTLFLTGVAAMLVRRRRS